jgi:microcin C transport system permease protein
MLQYILKRLGLIIPTLFGVILINFLIIQISPGGPVEFMVAKARGAFDTVSDAADTQGDMQLSSQELSYEGGRGLPPEFIKQLEKQYGFDQPAWKRFLLLVKNYATFDLGKSYFRDKKVSTLIMEKLPVSISLGFWSILLIYLIAIPLGMRKAVKDGSLFDIGTSLFMVFLYAIPSFLIGLMLIILFAGGSFLHIFPLRGLTSDEWECLSFGQKILDYFHHLVLPLTAIILGGFASLTMLCKNSFVEEIHKQYVITARSIGLGSRQVLRKHVFRNAVLPLISKLPSAFCTIFFSSNLLIEIIFSLDGLGLMGFEASLSRDYPVMFGVLFVYTLISLIMHLIGDLLYMVVDPRINLNKGQD